MKMKETKYNNQIQVMVRFYSSLSFILSFFHHLAIEYCSYLYECVWVAVAAVTLFFVLCKL